MIAIGDITIPDGVVPQIDRIPDAFQKQLVVANLEGVLTRAGDLTRPRLFNGVDAIQHLKNLNVRVVSLANNHITDYSDDFEFTKKELERNKIAYCGAGKTLEEARKPAVLTYNGIQYAFLAFGWDVINCKYVRNGHVGVNPLEISNVLTCIKKTKEVFPTAKLIVLPHWDYELERYPMPMHRELAKLAIDNGADAIFGSHPHCVQGIETYKGAPIVYSLGNWFLPANCFSLSFPNYTRLELAFEWDENNKQTNCYWVEYGFHDFSLRFMGCEKMSESIRIKELSKFSEVGDKDYPRWFAKNRVKKKLLPIFVSSEQGLQNRIKTAWVKQRHWIVKLVKKICTLKRTTYKNM